MKVKLMAENIANFRDFSIEINQAICDQLFVQTDCVTGGLVRTTILFLIRTKLRPLEKIRWNRGALPYGRRYPDFKNVI
jgi:hypothetical protein